MLPVMVGRQRKLETIVLKMNDKMQSFAKLKELQADTQTNAFAAHLILPNAPSPPTTRQQYLTKDLKRNI
jgi:hypothetical protein